MKQSARKQTALSLVPAEPQETAQSSSLNEFFDGWLTSGGATPAPSQPTRQRTQTAFAKSPLTSTDVMRVMRATVRESSEHRHWPPDVVLSFMGADVIKREK